MTDFPDIKEKESKSANATAMVYASLYFLLLAFFIYLYSVSVPREDRVKQVIGSIDIAFKGDPKPSSNERALVGDELGLSSFHEEVRRVFDAEIPLVESELSDTGDSLRFRVPVSQIFADQEQNIRLARAGLFTETARLLVKRVGVAPTDLEILMDTGSALPTADNIAENLTARRLNALVSRFLEQGVPSRNIFIGLTQEGNNQISFRFYDRDTSAPQFRPKGEDE
ncbi:flagellar motor protein MotB [Sneathiella chinensis]|uniref:Motility protein B-like N-terminal domain-containing protein n=1 Tax=Sneathiella chinensis TaxID=349750 RepID=A0ABQ5U653_9PROT|nr:flagellar motor protein MotB [Sneathiella chinensis]GLQ07394.1 hypothetical protein GCM10007924_26150 [Sneathiella chinensis]